jgi:hypothetical protein
MFCCLRNSVRRVASVGWAVNTGSTAQCREGLLDPGSLHAFGPQFAEHVEKAERLMPAFVAQIGAPPPDPVHLLGHVDHLESRSRTRV